MVMKKYEKSRCIILEAVDLNLRMNRQHETECITSNLLNLKTADNKFKNYTFDERHEIKESVEKSKAKLQ